MILAGPVFARIFQFQKAETFLTALAEDTGGSTEPRFSLVTVALIILTPLLLIVLATVAAQWLPTSPLFSLLVFIGHPFTALMIACLLAYILLRKGSQLSAVQLREVMTKALEPAGVVVLVTGAGAVFKQILVDSETGLILAGFVADFNLTPYVFGFLIALLVRVSQGSATVAMITAAGLTAPVLESLDLTVQASALMVIAIASGATALSHVNDSGFWLVSRYLHLDEASTLKSWTLVSTIVGFTGFGVVLLVSLVI